jgi:hypothetical protein
MLVRVLCGTILHARSSRPTLMPRYLIERDSPDGLTIPQNDAGAALCRITSRLPTFLIGAHLYSVRLIYSNEQHACSSAPWDTAVAEPDVALSQTDLKHKTTSHVDQE